MARLVRTGSIFRLSFSSVFLFFLSATVHSRAATRAPAFLRLPSRSLVRCFVRSSCHLSAHSDRHSSRPHPAGAVRPPPSPTRLASRPAVAMAYQAMQKSWFKMPAYSAVYNPAKKDIEAGDKSTKRQQRRKRRRSVEAAPNDQRCIRMTQLCCRCFAVRVVAACGCCALVCIRAVILNTGILQALSE